MFDDAQSLIVSDGEKDVGWLMYRSEEETCFLHIIVLLPEERHRGYGREIIADVIAQNPQIKTLKLDVQQRNRPAVDFYRKLGFRVTAEEYQSVDGTPALYYNMEWKRRKRGLPVGEPLFVYGIYLQSGEGDCSLSTRSTRLRVVKKR